MKEGSGAGAGTAAGGKNGAPPSPAPASGAGAAPGSSPSGAPAKAASPPPAAPGEAGGSVGVGSSPSPAESPAATSKPRAATGIPGVHADPAGDDEIGGEEHSEETGLQRALKGASAAVPGTPPAKAVPGAGKGEPGEGGEPKPPAEGEALPPPKAKFKLGDMEFESEEQAAHAHKSLRGQAASVAQRARDLSTQQQEFIQALGQAGLSLDATGKVVRGSQPPASSPTASPSAQPPGSAPAGDSPADLGTPDGVRSFLDSALNWKSLPQVIKMYEEQHGVTLGPAVAMRLVMEEVIPKMWAAIQGHTSKSLAPLQDVIGANQSAAAVRDLFRSTSEYVFHDGSPAFPELLNMDDAQGVHGVWLQLGNDGLSPEYLMSFKGIQLAVSLYRDTKSMKARGTTPPSSSAITAPPAPAVGNVDQATAAVRSVMQSLEAARGAVSPDLSSSEGQPFRPSGGADDRASTIRRAIRESRGKEVIPGVRFQ